MIQKSLGDKIFRRLEHIVLGASDDTVPATGLFIRHVRSERLFSLSIIAQSEHEERSFSFIWFIQTSKGADLKLGGLLRPAAGERVNSQPREGLLVRGSFSFTLPGKSSYSLLLSTLVRNGEGFTSIFGELWLPRAQLEGWSPEVCVVLLCVTAG